MKATAVQDIPASWCNTKLLATVKGSNISRLPARVSLGLSSS